MKPAAVALAALFVLLGAPRAGAEAPKDEGMAEARDHYDRGRALYEAGHYAEALAELRRANELAPSYRIQRSIGLVQGELGDYAGAVASLERFLEAGGDAVTPDERKDAEAHVQQYLPHVAVLDVTTRPAGATLLIDGAPAGAAPLPRPVMLNAGHHTLAAVLDGYTETTKDIDVAGGDHVRVEIELPQLPPPAKAAEAAPIPPPAPRPPPPPSSAPAPLAPRPRHVPWIGWAATGALAAGAAVTGTAALVALGDLRDKRLNQATAGPELDALSNRAKAFALVSDLCTVGAVAAAGISLYFTVLTLLTPRAPRSLDAPATVRVGAGPGILVVDYRY